jgi:hypothetical protein
MVGKKKKLLKNNIIKQLIALKKGMKKKLLKKNIIKQNASL